MPERHSSNIRCLYCKGYIYEYVKGPRDKLEKALYHECTFNSSSDEVSFQNSVRNLNGDSCASSISALNNCESETSVSDIDINNKDHEVANGSHDEISKD